MKNKISENYRIIIGDLEEFKRVEREIIEKYNISDFDKKTLYADEKEIGEIFREMEYPPLFSGKKLIVIKNIEKLSKKDCEKIEEYLKNPSSDIFLLMFGKSVKKILEKYVSVSEQEQTPEEVLFKEIYRLKKEDKEKLRSLIKNYLSMREKNFTVIISATEIYLKNVLLKRKKEREEIIEKLNLLAELDYKLKTGQIHPGFELEMFFFYLFT